MKQKDKEESFAIIMVIIAITCGLLWFKTLTEYDWTGTSVFLAGFAIIFFGLTIMYVIYVKSVVRYYVLTPAATMAWRERRLQKIREEDYEMEGHLKACCDYLNRKGLSNDNHIIVDDQLNRAGIFDESIYQWKAI